MAETVRDFEPSPMLRWSLATLSFAAGVIHLVMVPQHAQEALRVGLAFAVAGWFQIAFGVAMVVKPSRPWVRAGLLANVVFVATWVVSRSVGLPDWTGDGGLDKTASVDALCVGFEVAIIAIAIATLLAPRLFERWTRPAIAVGSVITGIVVATTAVLASPSTAEHVHDEVATHEHNGVSADVHRHAERAITYNELPPATKAEVDEVIAAWATRYPTAADAVKDGWIKATRNLYGIGAHYLRTNIIGLTAPFDRMQPNILLFDGEGLDARFAGVSYIVGGSGPPEGFTGSYDAWHAHTSVCLKGGTVVSLNEPGSSVWYSEPECVAAGGTVLPLASDEMLHLWIGPGYIDGAPIFAHDHPLLYDGYDPKRDG